MIHWKDRSRAAGIHLGLSLAVAALAAALVFLIWYPYPYREISGGRELFLILVSVDVVIGPLITLAVFDRRKPVHELRRDLTVVALLQVAALAYGLMTMALARPVHMVFEIDRLRIVHAVEVPETLLASSPPEIDAMPWTGPTLLAARPFRSEDERFQVTVAALQGVHIGARPDLWMPYAAAKDRILAAAKPVSALRERFPARAVEIDEAVSASGRPAGSLVYLPLVGRKSFWTVLLDRSNAQVLGFLPLDPY